MLAGVLGLREEAEAELDMGGDMGLPLAPAGF